MSDSFAKKWKKTGWATFSNSHFAEIRLPYSFYLDRQTYNILNDIGNLTIPLLLVAGRKDLLVPAKEVRSLYEIAPEPKTYLEFDTGHDYKNYPDDLANINKAIVEFFSKWLTSEKIPVQDY